jgi:hypothetical protein
MLDEHKQYLGGLAPVSEVTHAEGGPQQRPAAATNLIGKNGKKPACETWSYDDASLVRNPEMNEGIPTGRRSGVFILDNDPRNAGDVSLKRNYKQVFAKSAHTSTRKGHPHTVRRKSWFTVILLLFWGSQRPHT